MPGTPARLTLLLVAECAGVILGMGGVVPRVFLLELACGILMMRIRSPRALRAAGAVTVSFLLGWFAAAVDSRATPIVGLARSLPTCVMSGAVTQATSLGTFVRLDRADCGDALRDDPGTVALDREVGEPGTSVVFEGMVIPFRTSPFDVARARAGAGAYVHVAEVISSELSRQPFALAASIRAGLVRSTAGLPESTAAMVRGASIGDTSAFSTDTMDAFRRSGLAHVLAVSGTNVAIVMGALLLALGRLGIRSQVGAGAAGITLFVVVVGPESSVLRAAAMAGISLAALLSGRVAEPFRALVAALIVLIALQPRLVHSIGLHLSAAATAGIVLFGPPISRRLTRLPRAIALPVAVAMAAQIAVAPLLASTFGSIPVVGLVSNLVALPAVAPVTLLGICSACVGALYVPAGALVARLAQPFAAWILLVARTTGSWSWASLDVPAWFGWVIGIPVAAAAIWSVGGRE